MRHSDETICKSEWGRIVPILNDAFPSELKDLLGVVSVLPRIFEVDDPENRWWAGVAVDIKFTTVEGAQNHDSRLVALIEKKIGRQLERYPDNEKADKDNRHIYYNVIF